MAGPESQFNDVTLKEQPNSPKVGVHFMGYPHNPYDTESLQIIRTSIRELLGLKVGRIRILAEAAFTTPIEAQRKKELIEEIGFLGMSLFHFPINDVTLAETREKADKIRSLGLFSAVNMGLIKPEELGHSYLFMMFDEFPTVEVEFETHSYSDEMVEKRERDAKGAGSEATVGKMFWEDGNFNEALKRRKSYYHTMQSIAADRNPDIIEQLFNDVLELKTEGGLIIPIFGSAHESSIMKPLRDRCGDRVWYRSIVVGGRKYPNRIIQLTRNESEAADDDYARDILGELVMQSLHACSIERGNLGILSTNYLTYLHEVDGMLDEFSIDRIRAICENRESPLDIIRGNQVLSALLG